MKATTTALLVTTLACPGTSLVVTPVASRGLKRPLRVSEVMQVAAAPNVALASRSRTLQILPNVIRRQPLLEQRTPQPATRDFQSYPHAFAVEDDNYLNVPVEILSMAWAEYTDWLRRTVDRNVQGVKYEFDRQQWKNSIRKWWIRALEADGQAKLEFARLYSRDQIEREVQAQLALGQRGGVDALVEEEWGNIYFECDQVLEEYQKLGLSPIPVEADFDEELERDIVDCAIRGRWRFRYESDDGGVTGVDFCPTGP